MARLSAADARQLAADFHNLAFAVGKYRFDNWDQLSTAQRSRIEGLMWTLLNYSSDFSSQAIAITLNDLQDTLKNIKDVTSEAEQVIQRIRTFDTIIRIAAAATVLGATIASGNPSGIADALKGVYDQTACLGES